MLRKQFLVGEKAGDLNWGLGPFFYGLNRPIQKWDETRRMRAMTVEKIETLCRRYLPVHVS